MKRPRVTHGVVIGLLAVTCVHGRQEAAPTAATPTATTTTRPTTTTPTLPTRAREVTVREAVQRALPFLERDGASWMAGAPKTPGGGKCVSCHHVGFALWSHREAERAGLPIRSAAIAALEKQGHDHFAERPGKAQPVAWGQMLLGRDLRARGEDATRRRRAAEGSLLEQQEADGQWRAVGQFSDQNRPEWESDAVATMWTLVALASFDELAAPMRAGRDRAWKWVKGSPPGAGNEWLVARLLVELQLGEAQAAQVLRDRLVRQQRPDGGWSWRPGNPSNPFSTGESLYALALAGLGADQPSIHRGVDYLLGAQNRDGTWTMSSALTSKQGGDKADYVYSYWASGWATIALARTLVR